MAVCENEGNVSQDANFRAHLDNNWDSINREFENVWGQVNSWQGMLTDLQSRVSTLEDENLQREQEIIGLRNEITDFEKQVQTQLDNQRKEYLAKFDAQQKEIDQLNKAVFGYGVEVNFEQSSEQSNYVPQFNKNLASHELNYSTGSNGKHRTLELDMDKLKLKGEKI